MGLQGRDSKAEVDLDYPITLGFFSCFFNARAVVVAQKQLKNSLAESFPIF